MEEKEFQDSLKYKKLEDKKYKKGITLKRFILLVFAIVMILILIIGIRWRILYNMQENYNKTTLEDNWYYYSDSEDTIMKWNRITTKPSAC